MISVNQIVLSTFGSVQHSLNIFSNNFFLLNIYNIYIIKVIIFFALLLPIKPKHDFKNISPNTSNEEKTTVISLTWYRHLVILKMIDCIIA